MPEGVNEKIWAKARAAAAKQGHDEDWPYIMGIYKRMNGESPEKDTAEKTSGKVPEIPEEIKTCAPLTGMSKEDFIARFMKDVPEEEKNDFLAKYFPDKKEPCDAKKKASKLANAILKNARYGKGTINSPVDSLATDQTPDMTTANRLDNIATADAGSIADVEADKDKKK